MSRTNKHDSLLANGGRAPYAPRTTPFERAWRKIEDEATGSDTPWSPRSTARLYLLAERASGDAKSDDALRELGDVSTARLERLAGTRSRDFGDVAAKLAALIVENGQNDPVQSGGLEAAIHAGMCSCLADLVILGDRPLPDVSAVLDMKAPDFELRDATEAEAAEDHANASRESSEAQEASNVLNDPGPTGAAMRDLSDAHGSLDSVKRGIFGLRDLLGRPWDAENYDKKRRAALWAVEELEGGAENAVGRVEEAAEGLTGLKLWKAAE